MAHAVSADVADEIAQLLYRELPPHVATATAPGLRQLDDPPGGANAGSHVVATLDDGRRIGMKVASRVLLGTDCEVAVAEIARIAGAPNACRAKLVQFPKNVPKVGGQAGCVVEWSSGGPINQLSPAERSLIHGPNPNFFEQLGWWCYFVLGFGVLDRHDGNFVWDQHSQRLVMIDNEEAFHGPQVGQLSWIWSHILPPDPAARSSAIAAIKSAFATAKARVAATKAQWSPIITNHPGLQTRSPPALSNANDLEAQFMQQLT
jgi:hypothetical protein